MAHALKVEIGPFLWGKPRWANSRLPAASASSGVSRRGFAAGEGKGDGDGGIKPPSKKRRDVNTSECGSRETWVPFGVLQPKR